MQNCVNLLNAMAAFFFFMSSDIHHLLFPQYFSFCSVMSSQCTLVLCLFQLDIQDNEDQTCCMCFSHTEDLMRLQLTPKNATKLQFLPWNKYSNTFLCAKSFWWNQSRLVLYFYTEESEVTPPDTAFCSDGRLKEPVFSEIHRTVSHTGVKVFLVYFSTTAQFHRCFKRVEDQEKIYCCTLKTYTRGKCRCRFTSCTKMLSTVISMDYHIFPPSIAQALPADLNWSGRCLWLWGSSEQGDAIELLLRIRQSRR